MHKNFTVASKRSNHYPRPATTHAQVSRSQHPPVATEWQWHALFIAGILLAPLVTLFVGGDFPEVSIIKNPIVLLIAGLIVGVGTVICNCPGPAIAAFFVEPWALLVFLAGMIGGMAIAQQISSIKSM